SGIRWLGVEKHVLIFASKLVFTFPSELMTSLRILSYLGDRDAALLQPFDLSVRDLYQLLDEIKFVVDLDLLQQNDE
ncbi:hypothetical protein Tco_0746017, partial [Tanacetum coccineum]